MDRKIDSQIDRQTDRQIDRQIDRLKDSQIVRQIVRQLDSQIDRQIDRQIDTNQIPLNYHLSYKPICRHRFRNRRRNYLYLCFKIANQIKFESVIYSIKGAYWISSNIVLLRIQLLLFQLLLSQQLSLFYAIKGDSEE